MFFLLKALLAALVIAFASWLSGKKPELSGFIIALPIASIIAIAYSYLEHKNAENSVIFAKSILIGVPVSYLFFLPFFFAKFCNFSPRAMVPSSSIISQITAELFFFANLEISTDASV